MLIRNIVSIIFGLTAAVNAAPGLTKRATISKDGKCSATVTCVGSEFGDCCSQYGYCGSSEAHCGTSNTNPGTSTGGSSGSNTSLKVSTDGTCGKTTTCHGYSEGSCCSQWGYCGSSPDHCGTGCKTGFGTCTSSAGSGSTGGSASGTAKPAASASTKPAASSVIASSAPATTSSATTSPVTPTNPNQIVVNPSFEDGTNPWTFTGAAKLASNGESNPWYFTTAAGTKYGLLVSNLANPTSSITQNIESIPFSKGTISFDWQYMVSSSSRGPPQTRCTLTVGLGPNAFLVPFTWTRPGSAGGTGRVQTTFDMGIGAGDLSFSLTCTNPASTFQAGVVIDNVNFTAAS